MTPDNINSELIETDDRRQFGRKRLIVDIHYNGGEATGIASTRDIGIGGLYMTTAAELLDGTQLLMRMMIGEEEVVVSGTVVYVDPGQGVGIRFNGLTEETENLLKSELPITDN